MNTDLYLGNPLLDEPVDRGPYDREKWEKCSCCGLKVGDIRDLEEHWSGDSDE